MSPAEARAGARSRFGRSRVERSRSLDLQSAIGIWICLLASLFPLLRVVENGGWLPGALGIAAAVLASGVIARRFRLPALVVSLIEIAVWLALLTAAFGRATALLWIIPTPDTFSLAKALVEAAVEDVALGAAPLSAGVALTFLIVGSMGALAIVLDHVVLTARMPLLAGVGLVAVSLIPSIAVPGEVDVFAFALLAVGILFLLRVDTRARQRTTAARLGDAAASRGGRATATAIGVGTIAVLVAIAVTPFLPTPLARSGGSGGALGGTTIDPSLELGDDLRRPGAVEVLRMRWSGSGAPYLRIATLSEFDGAVWDPDSGPLAPLPEEGPALDRVSVDEGIGVENNRATIDVIDLNSRWAPVTYPAVDVAGLEGNWAVRPDNRTVVSGDSSVQTQSYDVVSEAPKPTLEQIRERRAGGVSDDDLYALPGEVPSVIGSTAREITAGARSDYDALVALQSWFRGSNFSYSLDAPVSEGFDGTGVDAIAEFLDVREGYCVHFAATFAVMARELEMPARIVVGYLPGTTTGEIVDGEIVYSVESTQLHAWPEVSFEGIGWVPFEPTNGLGTPTSFASGATAPGSAPTRAPGQTTAPQLPTPTSTADEAMGTDRDSDQTAGSTATRRVDPWPIAGIVAIAIAILALPGVARAIKRRRRLASARRGRADAAWTELRDLAVDLGIPVPAAETPREFGRRIVRQHGADAEAVRLLVEAIERESYAEQTAVVPGAALVAAVRTASAGLHDTASRARGALAAVAPRSLLVRPGTPAAGTLAPRDRASGI